MTHDDTQDRNLYLVTYHQYSAVILASGVPDARQRFRAFYDGELRQLDGRKIRVTPLGTGFPDAPRRVVLAHGIGSGNAR